MLIINDIHVGAMRRAGTTPQSQEALRSWIFSEFETLLRIGGDDHIVVLGDLFDAFNVDERDFVQTFLLLKEALQRGTEITLVMGNHDASAKNTKLSSYHALCHVLADVWGFNYISHEHGFKEVEDGVYAISHCLNQDLFNLEIEKAIEFGGKDDFLLLHCNIKSNFCADSDHSLNLDDDQLGRLMVAGWTIICGHEHQMRTLRGGRVVIPGNQAVTSISDCLNCDGKYYVRLHGKPELVKYLDIDEVFSEVDWETTALPVNRFVRVTGTAKAEQASDVVNAIAAMRKNSDAYVISNAVKIDGVADFAAMTEASFEDIKGVDVLGLLLEEFDAKEQKVIKELLA